MTLIRYKKSNSKHTIEIDGHAEFAKRGQDIVCSAISAITYSLINALEKQQSADMIYDLLVDYGVAHINISFLCPDDDFADALLCSSLCGYRLIFKNYPANVQLVEGFSI